MMNSTGPKSSLFVPEESFEQLARMQIKILEEPSLRCIDLVHDELQRILNCIEVPENNNLREKIIEVVNNLLRAYKQPTREMVRIGSYQYQSS
uniref:Dynamin stalk domain-containing protein n=1 Tax=Arcella intermedia TaxID=1963864 RepID=A0A6B2LR97_9EUKA